MRQKLRLNSPANIFAFLLFLAFVCIAYIIVGATAILDTESWRLCNTVRVYRFFEMVYCENPGGSGEIGVSAYHITPKERILIGRGWGIRRRWGGIFGLNYANLQTALFLEDGSVFFGAKGVTPEFIPIMKEETVIGIRIRVRGSDGSYAERVIMTN